MKAQQSKVSLHTPTIDLAGLTDRLGQAWGVTCGAPLVQYLAWSETAGLFALLARREGVTLEGIFFSTPLTRDAADALICILVSLQLASPGPPGTWTISEMGREYLLRGSPYYIGEGLYLDCARDLPPSYLKPANEGHADIPSVKEELDISRRLRVQHSRNFAPSVVAVRNGAFKGATHVVDMAGGSGVFSIPLALEHPNLRITLVERPEALEEIHRILTEYGVERRVELLGMDVLTDAWAFPACDGIVFGNFFHANDDSTCQLLAIKSFQMLSRSGKIWLHEVLFDESKEGPLLAALWNANMLTRRQGARQRTSSELMAFLRTAGFVDGATSPTAARFSLVSGTKPD